MLTLLNRVKDVIEEKIELLYLDDPEGGGSHFQYFVGAIPPKRDNTDQGEEFPFCEITLSDFTLDRLGGTRTVQVAFGLYNATGLDDGLSDLDTLLGVLSDLGDAKFNPFSLIFDVTGEVELPKHPYYRVTMELTFRAMHNNNC